MTVHLGRRGGQLAFGGTAALHGPLAKTMKTPASFPRPGWRRAINRL
jgi:hypothetical protein